jgi:GcrA cell cycle regulator
MGWTDEKINRLKRLWSEGLTTAAIGNRLGVSKNAVVGKVHRLELDGRPSPLKQQQKVTEVKETMPRIFTLTDMSSQTCRWPSGDPQHADFRFCGRKVTQGKPYCVEHCDVAYLGRAKASVK